MSPMLKCQPVYLVSSSEKDQKYWLLFIFPVSTPRAEAATGQTDPTACAGKEFTLAQNERTLFTLLRTVLAHDVWVDFSWLLLSSILEVHRMCASSWCLFLMSVRQNRHASSTRYYSKNESKKGGFFWNWHSGHTMPWESYAGRTGGPPKQRKRWETRN